MNSKSDLVASQLYGASMTERTRDNTVLDILTMVILFIMAVYINCDHSDTFRITAAAGME